MHCALVGCVFGGAASFTKRKKEQKKAPVGVYLWYVAKVKAKKDIILEEKFMSWRNFPKSKRKACSAGSKQRNIKSSVAFSASAPQNFQAGYESEDNLLSLVSMADS